MMYGATERCAEEHIIYVSVGAERQRFGESSSKGKIFVAALGLALVACAALSQSDAAAGLAQKTSASQLASIMALKESHHEVMNAGTVGLPKQYKSVLTSLLSAKTFKLAADCSNPEAYATLKESFGILSSNLTTHNDAIAAEDTKLFNAYTEAKQAWLDSESQFRTAESSAKSATEAADYAKSKYDEYTAAKSASQAEYDKDIVPLLEEKDELSKTIPVLEMIQKMVDDMIKEMANSAAAKAPVQSLALSMLPQIKRSQLQKLASRLVALNSNKPVAAQVKHLATILQEGQYIDKHMLEKLPSKIIASMQARLDEIAVQEEKMKSDLAAVESNYESWRQKLVELSEAKDKSLNTQNSADLERQKLDGEHLVSESTYQNYHTGYVEEAAKLATEMQAVQTIEAKIDEAIAACGA